MPVLIPRAVLPEAQAVSDAFDGRADGSRAGDAGGATVSAGDAEKAIAPVVALKRAPDQGLVEMLRKTLERAESGEIVGAVVFANAGDGYSHCQQGHMPFETTLLCLESWKFVILSRRELEIL